MSRKNPVTPPGINPGTVGLVAQRDHIKIHLTKQGECELESSGSEYAVHKLWFGSCEQCDLLKWRLASVIARCPKWTLLKLLS
jgi:hypothetical protein